MYKIFINDKFRSFEFMFVEPTYNRHIHVNQASINLLSKYSIPCTKHNANISLLF